MKMETILERIGKPDVVLLDGAMGTELFRRGIPTRLPLWSAAALLEKPEIVRNVHQDYIQAGAEILTANTFRTTTRALGKAGLGHRAKELSTLAVNLAQQARDEAAERAVWIAGSVAPLEDCYEPDLIPDSATAFREHLELIDWLVDAGVDLILIETMNSIREAEAALRAASSSQLPVFVSWTCAANGKILNGESVRDAVLTLSSYGPAAFLVNCTGVNDVAPALSSMRQAVRIPLGAYANIGKPEPTFGWELTHETNPAAYAQFALQWAQEGAAIIGGCCGTTPDHISALHKVFHGRS